MIRRGANGPSRVLVKFYITFRGQQFGITGDARAGREGEGLWGKWEIQEGIEGILSCERERGTSIYRQISLRRARVKATN